MAVVRPLEEDELDPALREGVQFFEVPLGVIPSSVRTMVHRPEIARASINLNIAVTTGYGAVTPEFNG